MLETVAAACLCAVAQPEWFEASCGLALGREYEYRVRQYREADGDVLRDSTGRLLLKVDPPRRAARHMTLLATIDLGIKALAACPVRSVKRGGGQAGETLRFAGAEIAEGAWVYADPDGVLVAPERLTV